MAVLLFVACSNALSQSDPKNINGYGKATWGMTVDEVQKAEPSCEKPKEDMNYDKAGYDGLLVKSGIDIGSSKFDVIFCFGKNGQKLVSVHLNGLEKRFPSVNERIFISLEQLLTEKYGTPSFKAEMRVSWKLPKTTIELVNSYMANIATQVMVIYTPTEVKNTESNNL